MKKITAFILALVLLTLGFAGCDKSSKAEGSDGTDGTDRYNGTPS